MKVLRRIAVGVGVLLLLVLGVGLGGFFWLRGDAGQRWLLARLTGIVQPNTGSVVIVALRTDLTSRLTVEGVVVQDADGRELARIETIDADFSLRDILHRTVRVTRLQITGLGADLAQTEAGFDLLQLWSDPTAPPTPSSPYAGLPVDLVIEGIDVSAPHVGLTIADQTVELTGATLRGGLGLLGDRIVVSGLSLDAATTPDLGPLALRVDVAYDPHSLTVDALELGMGPQRVSISGALGSLDAGDATAGVHIRSVHLEPERLPWDLPLIGVFDVDGELTGLVEAPVLALRVVTAGGPFDVAATLDRRSARPTWTALIQAHDNDLGAFLRGLDAVTVDGRVTAEGSGLGWPEDLDGHAIIDVTAPRAGPLGTASVKGELTLAKGVVTTQGLSGATSTGTILTGGTVDFIHRNGSADVTSLDVDLADLRRFGVAGMRGHAVFVGTLSGDWSAETPSATVDGTLHATRVAYGSTAGAAALDGPLHLDWADGAGAYTGTFRARQVTAPSTVLATASVRVRGTAAQTGAFGLTAGVDVTGVVVGGASLERLHGTVHAVRTSRGDLESDLLFATTTVGAGPVTGDHAAGTLSIAGDRLVANLDVYAGERTVLGLDATGDMKARRFEASRLLFAPDETRTWLGRGTQTVTLADDGVDGLRLDLVAGPTSILAAGSLHTRGAVALTADVVAFPLEVLALLDPALAASSGVIGVHAVAGGTGDRVTLALDATADALVVPGAVHGIGAKLHAEGAGGALQVNASVSDEKRVLATVTGAVPVSIDLQAPGFGMSDPVDLLLDLPPATADEWNAVLDVAEVPPLRGSGHVQLSGTPLHPDVHVVADVELPGAHKGDDWVGLAVDAAATSGHLVLAGTGREGGEPRVTAAATATVHLSDVAASLLGKGPTVDLGDPATWVGDLDVLLTPDAPVSTLRAFVAVPDAVEGRLVGEVHVTGSVAAPVIAANLRMDDCKLDTVLVSPASISLAPASGGYDLTADLGFGAEGSLGVVAFVPLELRPGEPITPQLGRQGLRVDVTGEGVPLSVIAAVWPEVQEASGRVTAQGTVGGSLDAPRGDLKIATRDAKFWLASTGVAYDQVRFSLSVLPDGIALEDLHLRTSEPGSNPDRGIQGTIDGDMVAALQGRTLGQWKGKLTFHRPLISASGDRFLRLSEGQVGLSGLPPEVKVIGRVAVEEAHVRLDQRFFRGPAVKELPAWLHVHRGVASALLDPPVALATGIPAWLKLDLGVDIGRNAFLEAQVPLSDSLGGLLGAFASITLDSQVGGQLQIRSREGDLSITGQVVPLRGTTVLFGKPFDIRDDSVISFTGRDYSQPVLDLHATYDTRAYGLVEASISGVPDALRVSLTSSEYPSQDDVISLLLIGKPASELSAGQGASDGASAAAMSMLLTTVGQSLGQEGKKAAVMLITPDLLVVGSDTARVGKRIGSRVFVEVDVNTAADDRTTSYVVLTIDVALGARWDAVFTHGTAGEDSLGVSWTLRY